MTTEERDVSFLARDLIDRHNLRSRLANGCNRLVPTVELLEELAQGLLQHGAIAEAFFFTLKVWRGAPLRLVARYPKDFPINIDQLRQHPTLLAVHCGEQRFWDIPTAHPRPTMRCVSQCFSTNCRGALAVSAVSPQNDRIKSLFLISEWLSPEIESVLIRDGVLAAGTLKDMATLTWETLDAAEQELQRIQR